MANKIVLIKMLAVLKTLSTPCSKFPGMQHLIEGGCEGILLNDHQKDGYRPV